MATAYPTRGGPLSRAPRSHAAKVVNGATMAPMAPWRHNGAMAPNGANNGAMAPTMAPWRHGANNGAGAIVWRHNGATMAPGAIVWRQPWRHAADNGATMAPANGAIDDLQFPLLPLASVLLSPQAKNNPSRARWQENKQTNNCCERTCKGTAVLC